MIVIADSSPIISLLKIEQLNLLYLVFKEVIISQGVYDELVVVDKIGVAEIKKAQKAGWLIVEKISSKQIVGLIKYGISTPDGESIILAKQKKADFLLIDERAAREVAKSRLTKTKIMGVGGFLAYVKTKGYIPQVKTLLDQMKERGIWISESVYKEILKTAGEL